MTDIEKKQKKSKQASVLGFATAFLVALSMNDFKAMGYPVADIVIKSLAIAAPAIGGITSQIK